jgi:hypothetical protein
MCPGPMAVYWYPVLLIFDVLFDFDRLQGKRFGMILSGNDLRILNSEAMI